VFQFTRPDVARLHGSENTLLESWLPSEDDVATARLAARFARLKRMGLVARMSPVEWRFDETAWARTGTSSTAIDSDDPGRA
jgi:hypothetical protein